MAAPSRSGTMGSFVASISGRRRNMTTATLTVRDLHARYGAAGALHGVTLQAPPGRVVALLGRNGMGKSTTLKSVMRLDEPTVTSGSIEYGGRSLLDLPPYRAARLGIG